MKGRSEQTDNPPPDNTPAPQIDAGAERRRLEREILLISHREQRRIGIALHDGLGPHLTGLSLLVRGLARDLRHGRSIDPKEMDEIARLLAEGIEMVRTLALELNPFLLTVRGLTVALSDLASTTEKQSGITCTFEEMRETDDVPLTAEQSLHLYRIAQEAVANAVRHANASRIQITLSRSERGCRVAVVDDGIGYEYDRSTTANPSGMGLGIMRYRAELIGAGLEVGRSAGSGTGTAVVCTFRVST